MSAARDLRAARNPNGRGSDDATSSVPVWWLVFRRELVDLWIGGKALNLLILFSVLMSITAFLLATNSELSLTPPRMMIVTTLQAAISFGLFIGLVIAAESFSGERERATLEPLLLAPAGRRQIVAGKYLAALSPWPVALLISVPYVVVLAQGDIALVPALLWATILGSLVAVAYTGFGILVSMWSDSSRTSLFVSLLAYIVSLLPAQLPTEFLATPIGAVVKATNPLEAARQFMLKGFIEARPVEELWVLLYAPLALTALVLFVVFLYAAPRLGLVGTAGLGRSISRGAEGAR
jgi:ABC-2 type transport system permease protein